MRKIKIPVALASSDNEPLIVGSVQETDHPDQVLLAATSLHIAVGTQQPAVTPKASRKLVQAVAALDTGPPPDASVDTKTKGTPD